MSTSSNRNRNAPIHRYVFAKLCLALGLSLALGACVGGGSDGSLEDYYGNNNGGNGGDGGNNGNSSSLDWELVTMIDVGDHVAALIGFNEQLYFVPRQSTGSGYPLMRVSYSGGDWSATEDFDAVPTTIRKLVLANNATDIFVLSDEAVHRLRHTPGGGSLPGGTWAITSVGTVPDQARDLVVGDINGDTFDDVIVIHSPDFGGGGGVDWFRNDGADGFVDEGSLASVTAATFGGLVDLDGDTDLDIVVGSGNSTSLSRDIVALENDAGDASSWSTSTLLSGMSAMAGGLADLDGDDEPDPYWIEPFINFLDDHGQAGWWASNEGIAGGWTDENITPASGSAGEAAVAIQTGDYDEDGDLDVAVLREEDNSVRVLLAKNRKSGWKLQESLLYETDFDNDGDALLFFDVDNDGDLDIVHGSSYGLDGELVAWLQPGGGSPKAISSLLRLDQMLATWQP